ncbi:sulfatase-like hydrolase/transferase [Coraliomargarita parva]|uniref:sulfatase-like hydrolase/transferase n=1 Tax=Coraliomargarita parva TaxID=3014050 RepID=UPI0022B4246A|nr:sulfatase-like hydrolase/transferase [Coraliomargarita parva]
MTQSPNIILVVADQHRADFLGSAGHPVVQTPHFDRMAQRGIRYSNCVSSAPLCMPYRCSLQSGVYPFQHGAEDNRGHLELDRLEGAPLAELFQDAGYQTAYFGKCHWNRQESGRAGQYVAPDRRLAWQHWEGWNNGHFSYDMPAYDAEGQLEGRWSGLYEPEIMTDRAMRYMSEVRDPDQPFFIQMNWHPPHNATVQEEFEKMPDALDRARLLNDELGLGLPEEAYSSYWWFCQCFPLWLVFPVVPQPFLDLYEPGMFPAPPNVNPRFRSSYGWFAKEYAAMVSSLDAQMGRLRAYLDASGLLRDTIVIYTSDHGDYLGTDPINSPFRGKGSPAPESVRVPMLIEGPGIPQQASVDERPCNTMDLYASLLELAGIESPLRLKGSSLMTPAVSDVCLSSVLRVRSVFDGELIYSIAPDESGKWSVESLQAADLPARSENNCVNFDPQNPQHRILHDALVELLGKEGERIEMRGIV